MFALKSINRKATNSVDATYQNGFAQPAPRKTKSLFKPLRLNNRPNEVQDPQYVNEKRKLESFATLLAHGMPMLEETLKSWASVASIQCKFAVLVTQKGGGCEERMQSRFQGAAKHTVSNATTMREDILQTSVIPNILAQLHRIAAHVDKLRARHKDVSRAKTEFESCERRLRSLMGRSTMHRDVLVRARGRFERTRDLYNAMVDRMMERMVEVNSRMPDVAKTMHYMFWLLQERASRRIVEATRADMADSNAAEPLLCYVSFGYGLRDPASMFHALVYRAER